MEDYHQTGLQNPMLPTVFNLDSTLAAGLISIKLKGEASQETITSLGEAYQAFFPSVPYEFQRLDDQVSSQYDAETELGFILLLFSTIAIIIAMLGLIGLTAYLITQKRKEISVRKVLGSGLSQLLILLNKEYILLALLSFLIAAPISYLVTTSWLDDFAYHIAIDWKFFVMPLLAIVTIIIATTFKLVNNANNVNPSTVLKDE